MLLATRKTKGELLARLADTNGRFNELRDATMDGRRLDARELAVMKIVEMDNVVKLADAIAGIEGIKYIADSLRRREEEADGKESE